MGYKKILVTLDGSKVAELALTHLLEIARPGARVTLLSVMAEDRVSEIAALVSALGHSTKTGDGEWPPVRRMIDPREADARRGYLYGVSEWLDQAGFEVDIEVREGEVIETILKAAHEGYDVILMVRRSSADRRAIAVASVTEGVIKKAPCPVILIPAREG